MPRVNLYRGNAIQQEGTTAAKFVPADFGRSALGEGLQLAGRAIGEYAEREDQIQSIYDEQDANRLDLEHAKQTQVLSDRLREARGAGAREAADGLQRELEEFNSGLLGRARSQRARNALEQTIARRTLGEIDRYQAYADQEFVEDFRATNQASISASLERATDIEDPAESRAELENVFGLIQRRAEFEGWEGGAEGAQAQQLRLRSTSAYHVNRLRRIARGDPQAAIDYAIANRGEMTDEAVEGAIDSLNNEAIEQRMTAFIDGQGEFTPTEPEAANDDAPASAPREEVPLAMPGEAGSQMGPRNDPNGRGRRFHAGEDRPMAVGTEIPVALSGRVTFAGPRGNYGNLVIVSHGNGLETRYAHLSRVGVRVGQSVSRGDVIARSGGARGGQGSGNSTGPHLHYEMRRDGAPVNPRSVTTARVHPGGTRGQPAAGDLEQQVASIRDNPTLSWRERQVAESIVRRRFGEQVQARAFQENEADRAAAAQVAELGEGFTSMSQLPNGGADLGPQDRLRYSNMAQSNRQQTEAAPPSPELMLWVNYNRYANPGFYSSEQFLQQARQRGASSTMLRNIAAEQGQILGTRVPADRGRIWSIADPILQAAGIDFDRLTTGQDDRRNQQERQQDAQRKVNLLGNLERLHNIWTGAHPGQTPPDDVVREWVTRTLTPGANAFSLLAEDDSQLVARLNPRDRARAEQALRAANMPINEQTVAMAVRHRLARTRRAP